MKPRKRRLKPLSSEPAKPSRRSRSKFRLLKTLALGIIAGAFIVSLFGLGTHFQTELADRARRTAERFLPALPLSITASKALSDRLQSANLTLGAKTFVRIFKREALLEVWLKDGPTYRLLHAYPICKFSGFLGPKLKEGDKQAPEGFYAVTKKQLNPGSRHYRAFNLGFPNEYDRAHGRTGSALMVHGGCTSVGCYAMTDAGVAEIYRTFQAAFNQGQKRIPVHVFPFRMTRENLTKQPQGPWSDFWLNLKQGYDLFEQKGTPPKVSVCNKKYTFGKSGGSCQAIAGW